MDCHNIPSTTLRSSVLRNNSFHVTSQPQGSPLPTLLFLTVNHISSGFCVSSFSSWKTNWLRLKNIYWQFSFTKSIDVNYSLSSVTCDPDYQSLRFYAFERKSYLTEGDYNLRMNGKRSFKLVIQTVKLKTLWKVALGV